LSKCFLCTLQDLFLRFRQVLARPVDIKGQHGHGAAIRVAFLPRAFVGRMLERVGNLTGIALLEYVLVQIQRVAVFGDVSRPFFLWWHKNTFKKSCGRNSPQDLAVTTSQDFLLRPRSPPRSLPHLLRPSPPPLRFLRRPGSNRSWWHSRSIRRLHSRPGD